MRRVAEGGTLKQAGCECGVRRRQNPDLDMHGRPRDQYRFGPPVDDWCYGFALMGAPDGAGRKGRLHQPGRGMRDKRHIGNAFGRNGGELGDIERQSICRMIGIGPGDLDPCHIGQIGERGRRREGCDKIREIVAIMHDERRGRLVIGGVGTRHAGKEVVAHQPFRHRKTLAQRRCQPDIDIIAIDGETQWIGCATGGCDALRKRLARMEQGGRKGVLAFVETHGHAARLARRFKAAAFSMASARTASA